MNRLLGTDDVGKSGCARLLRRPATRPLKRNSDKTEDLLLRNCHQEGAEVFEVLPTQETGAFRRRYGGRSRPPDNQIDSMLSLFRIKPPTRAAVVGREFVQWAVHPPIRSPFNSTALNDSVASGGVCHRLNIRETHIVGVGEEEDKVGMKGNSATKSPRP